MRKKVDPTVELAAMAIQSQPWDIFWEHDPRSLSSPGPLSSRGRVRWWEPQAKLIALVKEDCCLRDWSDPYPGRIGEVCGECNRERPFERVPSRAPSFNAIPDLCLDLLCKGERLRHVSCGTAFAGLVGKFCDSLQEVLALDDRGKISAEKAYEAYWAFSYFTERVPDWDPTGEYGGAFEKWEAQCAAEGVPPWGPADPPELVPLVQRLQRERKEEMPGARRSYEKVIAPAEQRSEQMISEARRVRKEANLALLRNRDEEIRRWLAGPRKVNRRLLRRMRVAQEEANKEAARTAPPPTLTSLARGDNEAGKHANSKKRGGGRAAAALPDEAVALIHLNEAIRRDYEKAEVASHRMYAKAVARAERAYEEAMAARRPTRHKATDGETDWDILLGLAERLTVLDKRVEQAIGRFRAMDVMTNRDAIIRQKETAKKELGLPKRLPPPPPASGPQTPLLADWVRAASAQGLSAQQIHAILKNKAPKRGIKAPHISTIYRWIGPRKR